MSLKDQVTVALKKVFDPEMPVNIYELGLIYDVNVDDSGRVGIRMTLTAPNCQVAGTLPGDVERAVRAVPGVSDVKLELTFDPPWTKDRMSEAAKLTLGIEDIIPTKNTACAAWSASAMRARAAVSPFPKSATRRACRRPMLPKFCACCAKAAL